MSKAVKTGNKDIPHTCHWPGCRKEVPPKLWGCNRHWYMLPPRFRSEILSLYRPGQEIDKNPSDAYIEKAIEVHHWCVEENKRINGNEFTAP